MSLVSDDSLDKLWFIMRVHTSDVSVMMSISMGNDCHSKNDATLLHLLRILSIGKKIRKTISSNIYLIIHMRFWIQNIYWFENSSILSEMFLLTTENGLLSFKSMVYLAIQTDGKLKGFFQLHFIHFNSCWNQKEQSSFKQ